MTDAQPRKFDFGTVFDGAGGVAYAPARPKRTFTPEEVEQIRLQAYQEGERSVTALAEAAAAAATREIADHARRALGVLAQVAHEHRVTSAELAMAAARKIADAALEQFPEAPAVAALQALAREIEATPRLLVRVAPALVDRMQAALDQAAQAAGFPGQIVAKAEASMPAAAFVLDWGDGRAAYDPISAAARVEEALATALAAEGLHAEPLLPASETY